MSDATDRLARLYAAEIEILAGQEVRQDLGEGRGYRMLKMADYEAVRKAIKDVLAEIRSQTANTNGAFGFALGRLDGTGNNV